MLATKNQKTMCKKAFNLSFILFIFLSSCAIDSKECQSQFAEYDDSLERCVCKDGFVDTGVSCVCPDGTILIEGECYSFTDELFNDWEIKEECDQAGNFEYEVEIKESTDPKTILINNLFEIDQDIECTLKNGGCDFSGDPKINGFLVEGEMTWNDGLTIILIDYTIKGTAEENCSATLTRP